MPPNPRRTPAAFSASHRRGTESAVVCWHWSIGVEGTVPQLLLLALAALMLKECARPDAEEEPD